MKKRPACLDNGIGTSTKKQELLQALVVPILVGRARHHATALLHPTVLTEYLSF
jgi:hypothetical protein